MVKFIVILAIVLMASQGYYCQVVSAAALCPCLVPVSSAVTGNGFPYDAAQALSVDDESLFAYQQGRRANQNAQAQIGQKGDQNMNAQSHINQNGRRQNMNAQTGVNQGARRQNMNAQTGVNQSGRRLNMNAQSGIDQRDSGVPSQRAFASYY